jgi:hypothetical protein
MCSAVLDTGVSFHAKVVIMIVKIAEIQIPISTATILTSSSVGHKVADVSQNQEHEHHEPSHGHHV